MINRGNNLPATLPGGVGTETALTESLTISAMERADEPSLDMVMAFMAGTAVLPGQLDAVAIDGDGVFYPIYSFGVN